LKLSAVAESFFCHTLRSSLIVATKKEAPIEIGAVLIQYPMKNQSLDDGTGIFVAKELLTVLINFSQQIASV
jgi:hypothetical protein